MSGEIILPGDRNNGPGLIVGPDGQHLPADIFDREFDQDDGEDMLSKRSTDLIGKHVAEFHSRILAETGMLVHTVLIDVVVDCNGDAPYLVIAAGQEYGSPEAPIRMLSLAAAMKTAKKPDGSFGVQTTILLRAAQEFADDRLESFQTAVEQAKEDKKIAVGAAAFKAAELERIAKEGK